MIECLDLTIGNDVRDSHYSLIVGNSARHG